MALIDLTLSSTDIPKSAGPLDTAHTSAMVLVGGAAVALPAAGVYKTGMVHRLLCAGHLPPEPVYRLPHTQDRPRTGPGQWRGPWTTHAQQRVKGWRIQAIHASPARVQVLVRGDQEYSDRDGVHLLRAVQRARLLAHPRHVLYYAVRNHHESADQGKAGRGALGAIRELMIWYGMEWNKSNNSHFHLSRLISSS